MISLLSINPLLFFLVFPALLMSIVIHEFAHCWVTDRLGDPTPRAKGRLTLDPRAHLEPLGVVALLLTRFGWGKPAPYDPYNLQNPVRDSAIIAVAGPLSNLIIATIIALVLRFATVPEFLGFALLQIMVINIVLTVFNLLPIYPLDGSKVLSALLPASSAAEYDLFMRRYGMFVLLFMILPLVGGVSPVTTLLDPIINFVIQLLVG